MSRVKDEQLRALEDLSKLLKFLDILHRLGVTGADIAKIMEED